MKGRGEGETGGGRGRGCMKQLEAKNKHVKQGKKDYKKL